MDRDSPLPGDVAIKAALAGRIRLIRLERYGEHGGPMLAGLLRLPFRTWAAYEAGVTIPGEILLKFVELTGVEPLWLIHGGGERYRPETR